MDGKRGQSSAKSAKGVRAKARSGAGAGAGAGADVGARAKARSGAGAGAGAGASDARAQAKAKAEARRAVREGRADESREATQEAARARLRARGAGEQGAGEQGAGEGAAEAARSTAGARRTPQPARRRPPWARIAAVAAVVVVVFLLARLFTFTSSIDVTVNGQDVSIRGAKTLRVAVRESGLPINPGDLISLRGTVLEKDAGQEMDATVNGEPAPDPDVRLHAGDVVQVTDGQDTVEDYTEVLEEIPYEVHDYGVGVFRELNGAGTVGTMAVRTGVLSGDVVRKQLVDPVDLNLLRWNPDVGDTKFIALTFDGGPSAAYTEQVLDLLAQYGAHATFFVTGEAVLQGDNARLLRRADAEGHQICTHTYDNAKKAGGLDIGDLSPESQVEEVELGRQVIQEALGYTPSRVVRLPNNTIGLETVDALNGHMAVEVGWNLDSVDSVAGIGADTVAAEILSVTPGDVVLLHDGGDSCDQTIEALRVVLPQLVKDGWVFVTVDELLEYPAL